MSINILREQPRKPITPLIRIRTPSKVIPMNIGWVQEFQINSQRWAAIFLLYDFIFTWLESISCAFHWTTEHSVLSPGRDQILLCDQILFVRLFLCMFFSSSLLVHLFLSSIFWVPSCARSHTCTWHTRSYKNISRNRWSLNKMNL